MAQIDFSPTDYFNTLGEHTPVCTLQPGDRVRTTTADARGVDGMERSVATGPNPMTGPFYVEGAEPGDSLAVRLVEVTPNRRRGWTRTVIADDALEPDYLREVPVFEIGKELTDWEVDVEGETVRLLSLEGNTDFPQMALDPMIGCLGVAPGGGVAATTATSGHYGGNMDYVGVRAGATLYFPVSVPGGLFFLGDVHARQGDGEIVGTGVEISCDVVFDIDIVKGWKHRWPRGEDADCLFALGNARPLAQAAQHATSELSRWLCDDLGADLVRVHTMLGQCVQYDLGNLYNPAYTMVCKVARRDLRDWGISED